MTNNRVSIKSTFAVIASMTALTVAAGAGFAAAVTNPDRPGHYDAPARAPQQSSSLLVNLLNN